MHESVKKIFYRETTLLGPVLVLVLAARPECPTKFFTKWQYPGSLQFLHSSSRLYLQVRWSYRTSLLMKIQHIKIKSDSESGMYIEYEGNFYFFTLENSCNQCVLLYWLVFQKFCSVSKMISEHFRQSCLESNTASITIWITDNYFVIRQI